MVFIHVVCINAAYLQQEWNSSLTATMDKNRIICEFGTNKPKLNVTVSERLNILCKYDNVYCFEHY